jgi:hypothetical protein
MGEKGFGAHSCIIAGLEAVRGHLGALFTNDDSIISPWNLVHEPSNRVWVFRPPDKPLLNAPGVPYNGCWAADGTYGVSTCLRASAHFRPRDIAMQVRSGGVPTGTACHLMDTIYIPGGLAADLARILQLHVDAGTQVELAVATSLTAVTPIDQEHTLQSVYLWAGARDTAQQRWHMHWDAFHPLKLSSADTQAFVWGQFEAAAQAGLLCLPPPAPGTAMGPDGKTPRPAGERKKGVWYFGPPEEDG